MVHAVTVASASVVKACLTVIRPRQWVKNLFVLTPLLFTPGAQSAANQRSAAMVFAAFSLPEHHILFSHLIMWHAESIYLGQEMMKLLDRAAFFMAEGNS